MKSRTSKWLLGCGAGCGLALLLMISACVSFTLWLNRPNELVQTDRLRGEDTSAWVEWTLRMEDPGTRALVEDLLGAMKRLQDRGPSPLPSGIDRFLRDYQTTRNARELRRLFPCVVAWSLREGQGPEEEFHLLTVSVKGMGNRLVFADWILGWFLPNADEVELVKHRGEKIYFLPREGTAFFLRGGDFFFTTDLDTAKLAVDRLDQASAEAPSPSRVDRLLERLPEGRPLRGAASNEAEQSRRILSWLLGPDVTDLVEWDSVTGMTLDGGFTEESSFEATLDLLLRGPAWSAEQADSVAVALAEALEHESVPVVVDAESRADGVRFHIAVEDLPKLLGAQLERSE